ncbi:MAG: PQQ-binding-like beta-propeller repeat protein [Proteobacteria bacterium]|nr:PQQ-binding-like beta-propeller repeat protein [Pseudomonadota bacterium]
MLNFLARGAAALCVLMSATATSAATSGDGAETTYLAQCAACHGVHLGGAYGPPLSGKAFVDKWRGQGAAAMRDLIVASMPPAKPGSLDLASATGLTNFIARHNRMAGLDDVAAARPVATASSEGGAASGGAGDPGRNEDAAYRAAKAARTALLAGMTPVTEAMLRQPRDEDWLNWRRTDDGHGFSPLTQINSANARKLRLAFSLSLTAGTNQITPLVHDGVMFVDSNGAVLAIDARNGDILWKFNRVAAPVTPAGPPTTQPRNLALFGTTLYVPTLDNHMLALDARSGKLLWDHTIEGSDGVLRLTGGPMVVHGKVIQGVSGCSGAGHAGGCFILALDAASGKELWRFNTIARPGEAGGDSWNGAPLDKRFGGSVWVAGTYDATLNLVYFGTGQTYHITPLMKGDGASEASNDALYTDTTLALNPDTGQLVWHYQHHAREVWDLDWAFERTVLTLPLPGGPTRVVVTMGKLGILDALDARTGRYLFSHDMGLQNLVTGIDARTGRKTTDPALEPEAGKPKIVCPFPGGARSWPSTAYDERSHMLYIPMFESCMSYLWKPNEEWDIQYTVLPRPDSDGKFGRVAALNLDTRKLSWQQRRRASQASAALVTAGGLLFEGSRDRYFRASDSASGKLLWQTRLDLTPNAFPITYARDGRQYVAITSGGGGPVDVSWQSLTPEIENPGGATTLWVFALDEGVGPP